MCTIDPPLIIDSTNSFLAKCVKVGDWNPTREATTLQRQDACAHRPGRGRSTETLSECLINRAKTRIGENVNLRENCADDTAAIALMIKTPNRRIFSKALTASIRFAAHAADIIAKKGRPFCCPLAEGNPPPSTILIVDNR